MGKDEKNMFDVENKTELEGAVGACERTADVLERRYKTRVFRRGWQVRDLKEHPGIVATQIVGATSDTIVLEYFEEED